MKFKKGDLVVYKFGCGADGKHYGFWGLMIVINTPLDTVVEAYSPTQKGVTPHYTYNLKLIQGTNSNELQEG